MSFLVGRLAAGKEGAYFLQESKHAVGRLVEKHKPTPANLPPAVTPSRALENEADVLPEVLKHNLPAKIFQPLSDSSLSKGSKWVIQSDQSNVSSVSRDAINPLRAYVSLPQVTFGPKRWQLPDVQNSFPASTANDLRRDKYTPVNSEKLKAAAAGLSQIAKAFAVATALVFGGATLTVGLAASTLELHTTEDIRTKGKDIIQPKLDTIKEQAIPLRTWAEGISKKWHMERDESIKEKPLIKELSRMLNAKRSDG